MKPRTVLMLVPILIVNAALLQAQNRAFKPPEKIDPELPNVLVIGDSISIGYMLDLRKELAGTANVFRPATNCGPTTRGLEQIDRWLGDRKWDLIQFNHGLHDLKYMGPKGENLADPKNPTSAQQVPPEKYEANLRKLVQRLRKTNAQLVFCQTTPVPEGAKGRVVGDSRKYNEIAGRVMREEMVGVNGLFDHVSRNVPTREANVHYTAANSRKIAVFLAADLRGRLKGNRRSP